MTSLDGRRVAVVGSAAHPARPGLTTALVDAGAGLVALDGSPVDLVVHLPEPPADDLPLLATDEAAWDAAAEAPARAFLATLQAAHPGLAATRGRLVVVLPSAVLGGDAGQVAATTGWGTVRLLATSAARRWARDGVTVTTLTHRREGDEPPLAEAVLLLAGTRFLHGATVEV